MKRVFALVPAAVALFAVIAACGDSTVHNVDYGSPPDAAQFNTGLGASGDGYGSGGNTGGTDGGGAATCSDDLKQCAVAFTFPFNGETSVELRGDYNAGAWTMGDAMAHMGNAWAVTVPVPYNKPVQYKFWVNGTTYKTDPAQPIDATTTNNVAKADACTTFTCSQPAPPAAGVYDWRDAVIYFTFVDRFVDGNPANNCGPTANANAPGDWKGGDWAGVTQKIQSGYFADLGVNTLWVTVPVKNADTVAGEGTAGDTHFYSAYHGYWPSDPNQLESCFGTAADLKALVDAAHKANLKVLFDYAMVQVHISSPIYTAHNDWFWPNTNNGGDCICGQNCSWDTDYQRCWFASYLPHWNYTVAAARDFQVAAALALVKSTGVDGFRLDAIKHVDATWLAELRSQITTQVVMPESPQQRFYMVGETFDFSNRAFIGSFIDPATKLDGQFDFPLRPNIMKAILMRQAGYGLDALASFMDSNDNFYGANAVMSTFMGNADLGRIIHMAEDAAWWDEFDNTSKNNAWVSQPTLPNYTRPFERVANGFALLLTNRGAPLIYYGDEIGQPGGGDPDNRRMMVFSGLTADQQFLYGRIKALTAIRAAHPALRRGNRKTINSSADVWVYSMTSAAPNPDTVYVAINRSDNPQTLAGLPSVAMTELLTNMPATGPSYMIPARQTRIFVVK